MDASSNAGINHLLLIPCVILDFLRIHPFKDGNGRVSRLISLLLLYKSGYDVGKYISFEERIEATVLNSLTPISKAEICRILPDVSPSTVELVLGKMLKSGSIATVGRGRSTKYVRS